MTTDLNKLKSYIERLREFSVHSSETEFWNQCKSLPKHFREKKFRNSEVSFIEGANWQYQQFQPVLDAMEIMAEALEKSSDLMVNEVCEQCSSITAVRYSIKPARQALAEAAKVLEGK